MSHIDLCDKTISVHGYLAQEATGSGDARPYDMTSRRASVEETRKAILEATHDLWLERHYDGLTMEAVADAAVVSRQTVHRHFGSKQELMVAAARRRVPREEAARAVEPGDVDAAVRRVVARYEEMGDANVRSLELEGVVDGIHEMLEKARRSHRRWIERVFAPYLPSEADGEREEMVLALYAATDVTQWKLLRRDLGRSRTETEAVLRRLVEGVLQSPGTGTAAHSESRQGGRRE